MTIGDRIKHRRTELRLNQRELAAKLGYKDHSTLARIERGEVDLPQSRIVKFAKVLDVTPAYLMGWDAEPDDLGALAAQVLKDPALLRLVNNYMQLTESDRAAVSALVDSLATKKD